MARALTWPRARPRERMTKRQRKEAAAFYLLVSPFVVGFLTLTLIPMLASFYLGFTQWALLTDPPPQMKAAVITVGPHDLSAPRWGTGSFGLNDFLGWSDMVAHQEDPGRLRALVRQARSRRALVQATGGLPVGEAARTLLGTGAPWFESWLEHPEHDDPHWAPLQLHQALERTEIPVLLLSGQTDAATKRAGFEAGADDFIPKPFVPEELLARIDAHIRRRQQA